jgi:hypothetical protein
MVDVSMQPQSVLMQAKTVWLAPGSRRSPFFDFASGFGSAGTSDSTLFALSINPFCSTDSICQQRELVSWGVSLRRLSYSFELQHGGMVVKVGVKGL